MPFKLFPVETTFIHDEQEEGKENIFTYQSLSSPEKEPLRRESIPWTKSTETVCECEMQSEIDWWTKSSCNKKNSYSKKDFTMLQE